jgi:hypothetical protein
VHSGCTVPSARSGRKHERPQAMLPIRLSPRSSAAWHSDCGGGYNQPFSSAIRTASARLRASSFCIADERWLRTVPGER